MRRARRRLRLLRLFCLVLDLLAKVVIQDPDMMLVKQLSGILQPFLSLWALEAPSQRRRCASRTTMTHSSWGLWLLKG